MWKLIRLIFMAILLSMQVPKIATAAALNIGIEVAIIPDIFDLTSEENNIFARIKKANPLGDERSFTPESFQEAFEKIKCTFLACNTSTEAVPEPVTMPTVNETTPATTPTTATSPLPVPGSVSPTPETEIKNSTTSATITTTQASSSEGTKFPILEPVGDPAV